MSKSLTLGTGYRMSLTETASTLGQNEGDIRQALRPGQLDSLLGRTPEIELMEVDDGRPEGDPRVIAIGLDVVCACWLNAVRNGNKRAIALVVSMLMDSLERRFDVGFKVDRPEGERNDRLGQRMQALEEAFGVLMGMRGTMGNAIGSRNLRLRSGPWVLSPGRHQ